MVELIRAFVCIDIPEQVADEIEKLQRKLEGTFKGRFVRRENLHLTLKFLGENPKEKIEKAQALLSQVSFRKLKVWLEEIEVFSHKGMPRIIWVKVGGDVIELQELVDKSLESMYEKEHRFMSHLTIARVKSCNKFELLKKIQSLKVPSLEFEVESFKLKSSVLTRDGAVYNTLAEYLL